MRKLWTVISVLMLLSCVGEKDLPVSEEVAFPEGQKVLVTFSLPAYDPATKCLDGGDELHSLHIAVFGGSGYLKEYVKASFVEDGVHEYETTDEEGNTFRHQGTRYKFSAMLTLSESPRVVHLIGNGPDVLPFGYDTAILPGLLSGENEKAYWQMIDLPHGIRPKMVNGAYVPLEGEDLPAGRVCFDPDDETKAAFQGIALIRNWSKIVLTALPVEESNFTPYSLAVVNVPSRGTIVPYSSHTNGFVERYQDRSFTDMEDSGYPGNLPAGVAFNNDIPDPSDFVPVTDAVYLYERPVPSSSIQPSYVLIYGHFTDPDISDGDQSGDYYYKVDLMETKEVDEKFVSSYYPLFRNFKYQVVVKTILSAGHKTPAAAAASAGSADVSSDVTTAHLSDISDGIGRLHLSPWISKTFTREYPEDHPMDQLSVFFSQSPSGEPDMRSHSVTLELLPVNDGGEDLIYNLTLGAPSEDEGSRGWRHINFCIKPPHEHLSRTQVIRITGQHASGKLYRDVAITMQPRQPIMVICREAFMPKEKGAEQDVMFMIPDGLVNSMFPLDFIVEPEDRTLTPDNSKGNNNLPVISGTSISQHGQYSGKTTFQFVRTLTWEEYRSLPLYFNDDGTAWRTVNCYFKTNREENATTVWVYNEFFQEGSAYFENYDFKQFQNLTFESPIPDASDVAVRLSFEMEEDEGRVYPDSYPEVLIRTVGLYSTDTALSPGDEEGSYILKPQTHKVELTFVTTTSDSDISVDLSAVEYEDANLVPWHFSDVGFVDGQRLKDASGKWSNVAHGHVNTDGGNKTVLFGYADDPLHPCPAVTLTVNGLVSNGTTKGFVMGQPYTPTPITDGQDPLFHEINLKTSANSYANVAYELKANGYVTERGTVGRFSGNIRTMDKTNLTSNVPVNQEEMFTKQVEQDNGTCSYSFSTVTSLSNGLHFAAGGSHTLIVRNTKNNCELLFVRLKFYRQNTKVFEPVSMTPSEGEIIKYRGAADHYIWLLPRGVQEATLTFTSPEGQDAVLNEMVVKTFENGKLYYGGNLEN